MSQQIATISADQARALAAVLGSTPGADSGGGGERLPILKINMDEEDKEGREIKKGLFTLTSQDEPVYAKTVSIRPLSMMYQYLDYDAAVQKTRNKTIMFPNFKVDAIDEKGGVRCGKPQSKVLKENPALAEKYKSITCFRYVHCLVSYSGETATGEKRTVENVPALLRLKGANFNPIDDEYVKKLPAGRSMHNYIVDITTEKKKNGSVTYFVMHFAPRLDNPLPLDQQTYETMVHIAGMVKAENEQIIRKHKAALANQSSQDEVLEAMTAGGLDDDLED